MASIIDFFSGFGTQLYKFLDYGSIFGKQFEYASEIYSKSIEMDKKFGRGTVLASMILKDNRYLPVISKSILSKLNNISIVEDIHTAKMKEFSRMLLKDYLIYQREIELRVKEIFGVTFPDKAYIILNFPKSHRSGGASLSEKPPILTLRAETYTTKYVFIIIHELLHSIVDFESYEIGKVETEALLDYFVPNGIIEYKMGLIKDFNLSKNHAIQTVLRPESTNASKLLLSYMEKYITKGSHKTIFEFLQENGYFRKHARIT